MNGPRRSNRHARVAWLALALAMAPMSVATAQAPAGTRVLVMPFTVTVESGAPGGDGAALWLGEAASVLIVEGLEVRGVAAMPRGQRQAAFERLRLPLTPGLTRATTIRVAELIGASEVIFGDVRLGDRLEVSARVVRLSTGRELAAVEEQGELADLFEVFDRIVAPLAGATGQVRPGRPSEAPLSLETFESYAKGLVAATPQAQQRFLESAIREAPTEPRILLALWDVYSDQGDHERALASANTVSPDAVSYRQARFAVALSLVALRRYDGALQTLTSLHRTGPSAAISSLMGVVHLRAGSSAEAEAPETYFRQAVAEAPEHTDYLFNLGYALARAGRLADALTSMREVVRFDAGDGEAHRVMSALLASAGRLTEAQRELELARLLDGSTEESVTVLSSEVPVGLERVPSMTDFSSLAVPRVLIAAPAQQDQAATARFHLDAARSAIERGRDRDAAAELRRAIYLSPYEEEPHRLLGGVYQRSGRLIEAIEEYTVALWCQETVDGRVALGSALLETGQREAAQREATRALELDPSSADARQLFERAAP